MNEKLSYGLVYGAVTITVGILLSILLYIFSQGIGSLTPELLFTNSSEKVEYITIENLNPQNITYTNETTYLEVTNFEASDAKIENKNNEAVNLGHEFKINTIENQPITYLSEDEINQMIASDEPLEMKVTIIQEGILSMIVATLITIVVSLLVSLPIGIITAIYLTEYLKVGKLYKIVHFAIDSLAGIPSIIFGLFGLLFFSEMLGLGISLISGSLTVSIMLLPTIIRTTEEALLSVPSSYREGSLGLGATKLQTIWKVILPNAMAGIIVSIILAIGRIIGESAILVFTAGTVDKMPTSIFDSSATLTVKAYLLTQEYGDIATASAIGIVIIVIIISLNIIAKLISKKFNRFA